jgi:hypothetical protein
MAFILGVFGKVVMIRSSSACRRRPMGFSWTFRPPAAGPVLSMLLRARGQIALLPAHLHGESHRQMLGFQAGPDRTHCPCRYISYSDEIGLRRTAGLHAHRADSGAVPCHVPGAGREPVHPLLAACR